MICVIHNKNYSNLTSYVQYLLKTNRPERNTISVTNQAINSIQLLTEISKYTSCLWKPSQVLIPLYGKFRKDAGICIKIAFWPLWVDFLWKNDLGIYEYDCVISTVRYYTNTYLSNNRIFTIRGRPEMFPESTRMLNCQNFRRQLS